MKTLIIYLKIPRLKFYLKNVSKIMLPTERNTHVNIKVLALTVKIINKVSFQKTPRSR